MYIILLCSIYNIVYGALSVLMWHEGGLIKVEIR